MARRFQIVDVADGETEADALMRAGGGDEPVFQLQADAKEKDPWDEDVELGAMGKSPWDPEAKPEDVDAAVEELEKVERKEVELEPVTPDETPTEPGVEKPRDEIVELEKTDTLDAESLNRATAADEEKRSSSDVLSGGTETDEEARLQEAADRAAQEINAGIAAVASDVNAFNDSAPKKKKGPRGRVGKKELAALATPATYSPRVEDERQVELEQAIEAKKEDREEAEPLKPEALAAAVELVKRQDGPATLGLEELVESPTNPRRTHPTGEVAEKFVESVRRQGILQPLLVRPVKDGFQIVAGHRRFRAAQAVGLKTIPVVVRNLSDEDALEAQLVENLQRADVHPLEEAEAYDRLLKIHGRNADQIAERLGKSRSFVYSRLKLLDMGEPARKAFYEGKLDASLGLLIARIPAQLQEKALKEILQPGPDGEGLSYRAARSHIQAQYMLKLGDAPFNTKDQFLVPERGACGPCPDRTGNSPDLFGDVGRADMCSNPVCFAKKVSAHWMNAKERAAAKGHEIISQAEGKRLFPNGGPLVWNSPWVELNAIAPDDKEKRTWRKLLGRTQLPVSIAMDGHGHVHELVPKAQALSALAQDGHKWAKSSEAADVETEPLSEADVEAAKLDAEVKSLVVKNVLDAAVAYVEKKGLDAPLLRAMFHGLTFSQPPAFVLERRGFETEDGLSNWVARKADTRQLLGLAFELSVTEWVGGGAPTIQPGLKAIAMASGLNLKELEKGARAGLLRDRQKAHAEELFSKAELEGKAEKEKETKAPPPKAEAEAAVKKRAAPVVKKAAAKVAPKMKPAAKALAKKAAVKKKTGTRGR